MSKFIPMIDHTQVHLVVPTRGRGLKRYQDCIGHRKPLF